MENDLIDIELLEERIPPEADNFHDPLMYDVNTNIYWSEKLEVFLVVFARGNDLERGLVCDVYRELPELHDWYIVERARNLKAMNRLSVDHPIFSITDGLLELGYRVVSKEGVEQKNKLSGWVTNPNKRWTKILEDL